MSQALHCGTHHAHAFRHATQWRRPGDALMRSVRQMVRTVHGWIERSRQRRALRDLDDHMLDDIGLSRDEAAQECAKLFWQTYTRRHLK